MFADAGRFEFFPTLVWKFPVESAERVNLNRQLNAEIDRIVGDRSTVPPGGTWQTRQDLHRNPVFAPLTKMIGDACLNVLADLETDSRDLLITGCWANVNPPGAHHIRHNHPNNFLSGTYYVKTAIGSDHIRFSDPRGQACVMAPPARQHNRFNSNNALVPVTEGDLLIFPAWLDHEVPINRSNSERISIAFNMMFGQYGETLSQPVWQPTAGH